jgi:hypothetical protein
VRFSDADLAISLADLLLSYIAELTARSQEQEALMSDTLIAVQLWSGAIKLA